MSSMMADFDGMGLPAGMTPENMGEYAKQMEGKQMEGFMDSKLQGSWTRR